MISVIVGRKLIRAGPSKFNFSSATFQFKPPNDTLAAPNGLPLPSTTKSESSRHREFGWPLEVSLTIRLQASGNSRESPRLTATVTTSFLALWHHRTSTLAFNLPNQFRMTLIYVGGLVSPTVPVALQPRYNHFRGGGDAQ